MSVNTKYRSIAFLYSATASQTSPVGPGKSRAIAHGVTPTGTPFPLDRFQVPMNCEALSRFVRPKGGYMCFLPRRSEDRDQQSS